MPSVPPAVIAPALMRTSYLLRIMAGAAITPSKVTDEPTMPVAAAKIVAVMITARYKAPLTPASSSCTARNSRCISPDSSSR